LHFSFEIPDDAPNGTYILKFQIVDPLNVHYNIKEKSKDFNSKKLKDEKISDLMTVYIEITDGRPMNKSFLDNSI